LHELGHAAEERVSGIRSLEKDFYDRRTHGEKLERLGEGYESDEETRPDKFQDRYMGKEYNRDAFELLSMGLETIFYNKYGGPMKDKDFTNFIFGLLATVEL
jgi:hypothetical protein